MAYQETRTENSISVVRVFFLFDKHKHFVTIKNMKNIIISITVLLVTTSAMASDNTDISGTWRDGSNATFNLEQEDEDVTMNFPATGLVLNGSVTRDSGEFSVRLSGISSGEGFTYLFEMDFTGTRDDDTMKVSKCSKRLFKKYDSESVLVRSETNCGGVWSKN